MFQRGSRLVPSVCAGLTCGLLFVGAAAADEYDASDSARLRDQLDEDVTPLPAGMGALFVPSLTEQALEPAVIVFHGTDRVAAGRTGERIVLPPGTYEVMVGQGPRAGRALVKVKVLDGITTPVPAFFGALRVVLVNEDGRRVRGTYVIASADGRDVYGPTQAPVGDHAATAASWLLPPGDYTFALGKDPGARRDAFAFQITEGEAVGYRIVLDEGHILRTEFGDTDFVEREGIWRLRWVLGGTATLSSQQNQLAGLSGSFAQVGAFSRLEGGLDTGNHLALLRFNVDESFLGLDSAYGADVPLRSVVNEAEAELLYNYRMGGIVGPYVRGLARTSFFVDQYFPDQDMELITRSESGEVVARGEASRNDRVNLFGAFAPLTFQEGVGLGLTFIDNEDVTLMVRGGAAARQAIYRDGRFIESREGGTVNLTRLEDNERYGGELTAVAGFRVSDVLAYETRFDSFVPSGQIAEGDEVRPIFRWDNTVPLRLGRGASLVYTFSLRRDELALDELQTLQGLAVRFQHVLF